MALAITVSAIDACAGGRSFPYSTDVGPTASVAPTSLTSHVPTSMADSATPRASYTPSPLLTPSPSLTPTTRVIKASNYSRVFNSEYGSLCAAISRDKRYLALGDFSSGKIVIWDSIEWRDTALLEDGSLCISLAFSPDGKSLASGLAAGGKNAHIILYVWDLPSGKLSRGIVDFYDVEHLAFSPDGLTLVAVNGSVLLYQFDSLPTFRDNVLSSSDTQPSQVLTLESDYAFTAEYSPDDTVLAAGTMGGDVLLWHVGFAKPFAVLSERGHCTKSAEMLVQTIAFSWDGSLLASTICSHDVVLWDVATRTLVRRIETGGFTYALDFSPEGKLLITGSDRAAHVWDITNGTELCNLTVDTGSIVTIGFSGDTNRVLAASSDGSVIAWDIGGLCSPRGPTQQSWEP